jgi:hypothetical protein
MKIINKSVLSELIKQQKKEYTDLIDFRNSILYKLRSAKIKNILDQAK